MFLKIFLAVFFLWTPTKVIPFFCLLLLGQWFFVSTATDFRKLQCTAVCLWRTSNLPCSGISTEARFSYLACCCITLLVGSQSFDCFFSSWFWFSFSLRFLCFAFTGSFSSWSFWLYQSVFWSVYLQCHFVDQAQFRPIIFVAAISSLLAAAAAFFEELLSYVKPFCCIPPVSIIPLIHCLLHLGLQLSGAL